MFFLSAEKQEKIGIAKFRDELAFFGLDTSDMTDSKMKEAMARVGEMISVIGFTTEEITEAMQTIAKAPTSQVR